MGISIASDVVTGCRVLLLQTRTADICSLFTVLFCILFAVRQTTSQSGTGGAQITRELASLFETIGFASRHVVGCRDAVSVELFARSRRGTCSSWI